jgi:hypothetical protein
MAICIDYLTDGDILDQTGIKSGLLFHPFQQSQEQLVRTRVLKTALLCPTESTQGQCDDNIIWALLENRAVEASSGLNASMVTVEGKTIFNGLLVEPASPKLVRRGSLSGGFS